MTTKVSGPIRVGDNAELMAAVKRLFNAGRAEGAFAVYGREVPTGNESVVWIGEPGNPEGFATAVDIEGGRVWVDLLYVQPEFRRRGIATALVEAVAADAARRGRSDVLFGSMVGNVAMIAFSAARDVFLVSMVYGRPAIRPTEGGGGVRH